MAFGGGHADISDYFLKDTYKKEENTKLLWNKKWSWLTEEYDHFNEKLLNIAKAIKERKALIPAKDDRDPKPFPRTGSEEYGWLASKKDFCLEKYGPDYKLPDILPEGELPIP